MKIEKMDIRTLPPVKRHQVLLDLFRNLPAGESFEFINDHDPKPLYYSFRAMFGDAVGWEYLQKDPGEWKIRVAKTEQTEERSDMIDNSHQQSSNGIRVIKQFDVRNRPCMNRHAMVFSTFEELKPGEAFVFTNDHDPKPLYFKLEAEYSEPFIWEYLQKLPDEWIIQVSKTKV